ncbi:MAG: GtrA family protein [Treponemataceae bacterium]
MKLLDKTLVKFLLVGIINTLVGSGTMFLLYNLAHCSYWVSSACNYIVGGIVSFFLNKHFTFQNTEKSFRQFLFFAINIAVCYFIAYGLAKWAVYAIFSSLEKNIKENIALAGGMVLYTVLNYFAQRFIVFRVKE